jgi:hypothetical protein
MYNMVCDNLINNGQSLVFDITKKDLILKSSHIMDRFAYGRTKMFSDIENELEAYEMLLQSRLPFWNFVHG